MLGSDSKVTKAIKERIEQVKERLTKKPQPLSHKDKRKFSKIRNAIRKKTDVEYVKK
jgi:hypothetical protein